MAVFRILFFILHLFLYLCSVKVLFLVYHGFSDVSGISKKIFNQVKGLRQAGHEVHLCHYSLSDAGHWCRYVDNDAICDYGTGWRAALKRRFDYGCVYHYCVAHGIELVYARSFMNASPPLIAFFKRLRKVGIKCVTEIPTYPYDDELRGFPLRVRMELFIDRLFRCSLARQMNAMVTFSDADEIFGCRTINISNGVDMESIALHDYHAPADGSLHLVGVAEVHYWHGFDRLIAGLGEYYKVSSKRAQSSSLELSSGRKLAESKVSSKRAQSSLLELSSERKLAEGKTATDPSSKKVYFHIVGGVADSEMHDSIHAPGFAELIDKYAISDYVIFHGAIYGDALDDVFNRCAFAIGSLGRHRSGITVIKTLKNREYATRGIPFIYSEQDNDFDTQPYVLKAPADESPIDIRTIIGFLDGNTLSPSDIRSTVTHLTWQKQMQTVIDSL